MGGAKQIARENLDTIAFYRKMAVASTLVYLAGMVALGATFTYTELAMVAVCIVVFAASQYFMSFGTPRYSGPDSKELIDPGLDLNMEGGLAEHAKDAFILTSATLFLALVSDFRLLFPAVITGAPASVLDPMEERDSAVDFCRGARA